VGIYIAINDTTIKNITQIIDTSNAKSVFFPSPMELHPDHRMTTELIWNEVLSIFSPLYFFAFNKTFFFIYSFFK
jgi:hypothetical protein